jgi:hypothetical protein
MKIITMIVLVLKIIFVFSSLLKVFSPGHIQGLDKELKISRFLYYNASILLFLYWFNPWSKKISLEGEDKFLIFTFMIIEFMDEIFPQFI